MGAYWNPPPGTVVKDNVVKYALIVGAFLLAGAGCSTAILFYLLARLFAQ